MRRLLPLLAALAVLAPIAAGCGDEELADVSASEAAANTREAKSARVEFRMEMSGMGLPQEIRLSGEGISATDAPEMDMTFDLGDLLEVAGAEGDGDTRFVLTGGDVFVDPPDVEGLEVPDGARWVTVDLREVVEAAGLDPVGLSEMFRLTLDQQVAALQAAESMKEVGEEEIDGVQTTHLRGEVRMSDYVEALPPERRERAREAIRQLERLGGDLEGLDDPTAMDMWVDEDKLLRRLTSSAKTPPQQGVPAGEMSITMGFTDYGTELDIEPPPADDVYDATDDLKDLVASGALGG